MDAKPFLDKILSTILTPLSKSKLGKLFSGRPDISTQIQKQLVTATGSVLSMASKVEEVKLADGSTRKVIRSSRMTAKEKSKKAYFGLFPFQWGDDWQKTFLNLRREGRLIVAPILQTLILNRTTDEVSQWVDRIYQWPIKQVIPCHFASPIQADSQEFQQAFSFLSKDSYLPKDDLECLESIDSFFGRLS